MDPGGARRSEEGLALIEVLMSMAIVAIVGASLSAYFVLGMRQTHHQGQQQTAVQLALGTMEQARGLQSAALLTGRAECGGCAVPLAGGVAPYLDGTRRFDLPVPDVTALLPLTEQLSVEGVAYTRSTYVGKCYRAADGTCGAVVSTAVFYRVVVAVTWPGRACDGTCSHVAASLFTATATDPLFRSS
jgi:type II secretory pathway pseudopilin PulG